MSAKLKIFNPDLFFIRYSDNVMRNFLLLLLSFSLTFTAVYSQTPAYTMALGEYQCFFIKSSDKSLWGMGGGNPTLGIGSNPGVMGTPIRVALPAGTQVNAVASGLHDGVAADASGNVWFWGLNTVGQAGNGTVDGATYYTPVQVKTDNLGHAFTGVVQLACFWNETNAEGVLAVKSDGTVWVWGNTIGGMGANGSNGGTVTRPTQITMPGNAHIVKVIGSEICMALDNAGNVYTWGGDQRPILLGTNAADYYNVHKVTLPKPAKDIAGASMFAYALSTDGTLYGWGMFGSYLGIGTGTYLASNTWVSTPVDLTSDLALPHPIASVMCNSVGTHAILTDGSLWGWGDNSQGAVGNGNQLNFATYSPVYAWNWGPGELLQNKPARLVPTVSNFTNIFGGSAACFYAYAETSSGQLYSCGRNKAMVLGNGVIGTPNDAQGIYPDSWEQPTMTAVNPFGLKKMNVSPCPYCLLNPGVWPCSEYKIPGNTPPKSNPGAAQTITLPTSTGLLNGSASSDADGQVVYYKWQEVSGPSTNVVLDPTYQGTRLSGLVAGTYVFSLTVTDNGWASNTSSVTVVVKGAGATAPTVSAGGDPSITLPTSSITLAGTATGNSGATIKTTSWKELSGPVTAAIASPSSLATAITGLNTAGSYVFQLTATDNNNLTSTGSVTVVVNPAKAAAPPPPPPTAPPTVSAGKGQAIVLPTTSSVVLAGTAAGVNGATIKALSWKQDSGPVTATIASPSSLSTAVTGMTNPGNYVFSLYATDNNGKTAFGSMTVFATGTASLPAKTTSPTTSVAPTVSAGKGQAIVLPTSSVELAGTAVGNDGATIKALSWKQDSGPVTATIASPASLSTAVTGITNPGNYVFSLYATDNNGKTAFGSMTVVVTGTAIKAPATAVAPTVTAGKGQEITLPTTSVELEGTATGNDGATIKTVSWIQDSGPVTAKIASPASTTTMVSGLTAAGTYIFTLYGIDNNGKSSNGSMTVWVEPSAAPIAPTVNAGPNQTILLPGTSLTLKGTATGNGGATISNTFWTQNSGPSWIKFANEWGLSTEITGLVAGEYLLELSVTDSRGMTATSEMTVVVRAATGAEADSALLSGGSLFLTDSALGLQIYPNPVHDLLNLRMNNKSTGKVMVMILDERGSVVQGLQLDKLEGEMNSAIDVSRLKQGVYFMQIMIGTNTRVTRKFVKL
jgi:alpha-tubulin suppressor-like RCC1 family protein